VREVSVLDKLLMKSVNICNLLVFTTYLSVQSVNFSGTLTLAFLSILAKMIGNFWLILPSCWAEETLAWCCK